nr:TRAP transporter substrate-binding protein [Ruegeria sp. HKCCD8929]
MRKEIKAITGAAMLAGALAASASAEEVKINMPSTFAGSLTQLGTAGVRFAETVNLISGGDIEVKFYDPNALIPALEIYDNVSTGAVDAGWGTSGYWGAKNSALNLFAAVPFGPGAGEYLAWMWYGDGERLLNEIYHPVGIHAQACGIHAPETSGWFKEEITSTEDLEGLKMRFYGLGALVMQRMGVDTQLLAGGDIYPALERGTIDATEFSMPAIDQNLGFYNLAKHNYFPGWHQQSTIQELMINKEVWDGLSAQQQAIITTACRANVATQLAEGEAIQGKALLEMRSEGVTTHRWPSEFLDALEAEWNGIAAEMAAENPDFARVWENLQAFRAEYAVWKDLAYLD